MRSSRSHVLPTTAGELHIRQVALLATVATPIQIDHQQMFGDSSAVPTRDSRPEGRRPGTELSWDPTSNLLRFRDGKDAGEHLWDPVGPPTTEETQTLIYLPI